jgi:hypothetical protein
VHRFSFADLTWSVRDLRVVALVTVEAKLHVVRIAISIRHYDGDADAAT